MFFGTDFRLNYIIAEIDGKEYIIQFRKGFFKGIYDVKIYGAKDATIKSVYPGFVERLRHRLIILEVEMEQLRRSCRERQGKRT